MAVTGETTAIVVGAGITGLTAAFELARKLGPGRVTLLEKERRLGGKITTERVGEYVVEGGPDCFLASKPGGVELCRELGIEERLVGTNPALRKSFVKRAGSLYELPEGITGLVPSRLRPLLTTRILSVPGRLRAGLEVLIPPGRDDGEESIAGFVTRRFGREAYDWLVEPLLSGIYAGDGAQLSLAATFPQLRDIEREHGSILRMMWRGRPSRAGSLPAGFVTPVTGLHEIVDALEARLSGVRIVRGVGVAAVRRGPGGYEVALDGGDLLEAAGLVLATPAFVTADFLAALDDPLAAALRGVPFVSTATVSVAFPSAAIPRPLPGYGYVSPRAEGGPVVACTWTSNKFPARVPRGGVLVRFFVGRAGDDEVVRGPDEDLQALVRRELQGTLGITAEPAFWRVYRWPRGMPQYTLGHVERRLRIAQRLAALPGIDVAGSSYDGVGIPDCIQSARAAVARVLGVVAAA